MKNPAPHIRRSLYTLLNGNVTYDSAVIPVYEGEGEIVPNQIIIGGYSHADESNKNNFQYRATQLIDIVTVKNDPSSKNSDGVAEIVMNLIKPDTRTMETLSTADFQITVIGGPSMDPLREDALSGQKVVRRLLRYTLLVIEK